MGCCGSNRAALRLPAPAQPSTAGHGPSGLVRLRWRRRVTAVVDGPISRTRYQVSAAAPVIAVDPRDAVALLRTGFFDRVG